MDTFIQIITDIYELAPGFFEYLIASIEVEDIVYSIGEILKVVIPVLGTAAGVVATVVFVLIRGIVAVIMYFLESIPLFIFSKKAGHKRPWFAFIPFLDTYLMITLPLREFNIFNIIKTKKRARFAVIYIIVKELISKILWILCFIPAINTLCTVIKLIFKLICRIFKWRIYYDMLKTARRNKAAMPVSIIALIIPLVYVVTFIFSCTREPEYGAGNHNSLSKEYGF